RSRSVNRLCMVASGELQVPAYHAAMPRWEGSFPSRNGHRANHRGGRGGTCLRLRVAWGWGERGEAGCPTSPPLPHPLPPPSRPPPPPLASLPRLGLVLFRAGHSLHGGSEKTLAGGRGGGVIALPPPRDSKPARTPLVSKPGLCGYSAGGMATFLVVRSSLR